MKIMRQWVIGLISLWLLSGCAGVLQHAEPPKVTVHSVKFKPAAGLDLGIRVVLNVENPNSLPLPLRRIDYAFSLSGQEIVSGASENSVTIPGHGKKQVTLDMSANLINGLLLANQFAQGPTNQDLNYALDGKMDMGMLLPDIPLHKSGSVNLMTGAIK